MTLIDRAATDLENAAVRARHAAGELFALVEECEKEAKELRKLAHDLKAEAGIL